MTASSPRRAELLARLRSEAILRADARTRIVGRGGRRAPWMLYCWPLTMTGPGAALVADEMLDALAEFRSTRLAAFGVGALPLMTACLLRGDGKYTGLTVRSEAKRYGSCRQIDGPADATGPVVLVDDSISSGTSMMTGIRILERAGYDVEGAVCLVDFRYGGGVEYARARGYRIKTLFDVWDDLQMPRPTRPPLYLRHLPDHWSDERVPDGLPAATVARLVVEHLLATDEVLRPPTCFDRDETDPGGVWVSVRRRADDRRLAREGFWHFDPKDAEPARDVVIAAASTARALGSGLTKELLDEIKIAVTFMAQLEGIEPRELDFRRYGIVVRSRHIPAKMGGALPNTQLYTSSFEQYRHARVINARIGRFEPHELFRHDLDKRPEPGEHWPAYGEDEARLDRWIHTPGLGEALLDRVRTAIRAPDAGQPQTELTLPADRVRGVCVSLYDRGLVGCAVALTGTVEEMLRGATRRALQDSRFGERPGTATPRAVTVSLLYEPERHRATSAEYIAWRMRAGRDSLLVREGTRWALFLDSVVPHYAWTKRQTADQLLGKAGIDTPTADWTTYQTAGWCSAGRAIYPLEFGGRRRSEGSTLAAGDVAAMAEHLYRRLDGDGWPAARILCRQGRYERHGAAARSLHALAQLHAAAGFCDRPDWSDAARRGIDHALRHLGDEDRPALHMPGHAGGPIADAILLDTVCAHADASRMDDRVHRLAARISTWVRADGSVRPEGAVPSTADADYLPAIALLALARYSVVTGRELDVAWAGVRAWYRRRFELLHTWGLASWHAQAWPLISAVSGDDAGFAFTYELADWMIGEQLIADGSFLTDMCASGPSWHTSCAALGVVAAWQAALRAGDSERARRYRASWRAAMRFLDRLVVRPDDAYWMPAPDIALGGMRATQASFEMRVDATSESLQALLGGVLLDRSAAEYIGRSGVGGR